MSKILAAVAVLVVLFVSPAFAGEAKVLNANDVKECHMATKDVVACDDVRAVVETCTVDQYNMYCWVGAEKRPTYVGEYWCDFGRVKFGGCHEAAKADMADIYELAEIDLPAAKAAFATFWPKAVTFVGKRFKDDFLEERRLKFKRSMKVLQDRLEGK